MKQKLFLLLIILPFFSNAQSQNCNCELNFNWVKKTFEKNDAGYSYVLDSKGKLAYEKHNEEFNQKVKDITNAIKCAETLYEWITFFRSGHIGIRSISQNETQSNSEQPKNDEIIKHFEDWKKLNVDFGDFTKHIQSKKNIDYEGIWVSGSYKIGIKKVEDYYLGFIIEADGVYWTEGQVKLQINSDNSSTYYMRDHSAENFENAELLGNNYLQMGFITLKRISPELESNPKVDRYFKAISAEKPYFEEIDENTTLLRIPKFWSSERKDIDSVILANKELILKTPNLIIDLRNNGGGSDRSFKELLPIIYTNPIRTVGVELLSTPLNNQRMLDLINNPEYGFDEESKKWAKESYDKLSKHIGEFVNLDSTVAGLTTFDTTYLYPENIGIIINENNASTTEQFLLAAKQSKKVKLFGTTTAGILDISNMYFIKSPCEEFELGYSLSKSMRIPEMTIDDRGIQPDYYIDKSIPQYEWIEFVYKVLNE
jgi:Peptidase family S41